MSSATSPLHFVCILGSVRDGRQADNVLRYFQNRFDELMKPKGHTVQIVDPIEVNLPLLKCPLHWYQDPSQAPQNLKDLNSIIESADGYFILSPEYNRSMPPALVNLLDHLPTTSMSHKASGIISYSMGQAGSMSVVHALMPMLWEFGCYPVHPSVNIKTVHEELSDVGTTENSLLDGSMAKMFEQLEWQTACTKEGRARGAPVRSSQWEKLPAQKSSVKRKMHQEQEEVYRKTSALKMTEQKAQ